MEKAKEIFRVKKDVERYAFFKRAKELGIVFTRRDLSFSDLVLFGHIEDEQRKANNV